MATLGEARMACAPIGSITEVEGEDVLEDERRRCVGWKYGSCADKPMRLSTGSPNYEPSDVHATRRDETT